MKDISAFLTQGFFESGCGLPMSQRQIDHELLAQIFDLTAADGNVVLQEQVVNDFIGAAMSPEKALADKNHHVITKTAPRGRQAL